MVNYCLDTHYQFLREHFLVFSEAVYSLQKIYIIYIFAKCPRSSDPFYIVTYYIKLVTTCCIYSLYSKDFYF